MEEEKAPSPEYIKAFNNGYLLAQHEPELAAQLSRQQDSQNDYVRGLLAGKKQHDTEIEQWRSSFSKGTPSKGSKDLDKER